MPDVARSIDLIPAGLREKIGLCVNGKAPWPLLIHGPPGVGKTCSALCVIDRAYSLGVYFFKKDGVEYGAFDEPSGVYKTAHEICDAMFAEHGKKGRTVTDRLWKEWTTARLTVLDELGSREKVGDFVYNTTKQLIDVRSGKPLIVISNLDLPTLAVLYDDRLTSRLAAGTVVEVRGKDRRVP